MKGWVERLKFMGLLYFVYLLIRIAALTSETFRAKLLERDIAIVMQSEDKRISRTIRCRNGRVRSQKGEAPDVISRIVWATPATGSRVIMKLIKGDPKALVNAVIARDLMPRGDAGGVRWFLDVVSLLNRTFLKRKDASTAAKKAPDKSNTPVKSKI